MISVARPTLTIARTTLIELFREKLVLVSLFLGFLFILFSFFLGSIAFSERTRVIFHLGFSTTQVVLWLCACFVSARAIQNEIEKQTCLMILARPISRTQFFIGKWLGVLSLLFLIFLLLILVVYFLVGSAFAIGPFVQSALSLLGEAVIISAFAFFFASFMQPVLAAATSFALIIVGYWTPDLHFFAEKSGSAALQAFSAIVSWGLPQFYRFNFKSVQWVLSGGDTNLFLMMILHSLSWSLVFIIIAQWIFRRRDLN